MDNQPALNILFGVGLSIAGWFARELWAAVKELKSDLAHLREDLPSGYVARNDHRDSVKAIMEMLNKIFDRLDGKVDK
jgi:hypothetical protein